ncbi:unnamed protein product [Urochloa humidicola]
MPASTPCFDSGRSGTTHGFDSGVLFVGLIAAVPTRWGLRRGDADSRPRRGFHQSNFFFPMFSSMATCTPTSRPVGNDPDADPSHSIASRSSSTAPQSLSLQFASLLLMPDGLPGQLPLVKCIHEQSQMTHLAVCLADDPSHLPT